MTKKERIVLSLAVIAILIILAFLRLTDRIDDAQAIQILITFALVCVTLAYVKRTAEIAKATKEQAEASVKMAEDMREPRYDAVRPVIDIINIEQTPSELAKQAYANKPPNKLRCKLCNVGFGPAIDLYSFVQPPSQERRRHDFHTITIGKEKSERLSLEQKEDRWFLVAYYEDVYGRCFESNREVRVGVVNPDSLQFREIACEELPK